MFKIKLIGLIFFAFCFVNNVHGFEEALLEEDEYIGLEREDLFVEVDTMEDLEACEWCDNSERLPGEKASVTVTVTNITVPQLSCIHITSPNYPKKYPKNKDMRYHIQTDPGASFTVSIPKGGMQMSGGCHRDKLSFRNSTETVKICGSIDNFIYYSGDDYFYMRFETNHRIQWKGFNASICASEAPTTPKPTTTPPPPTTTEKPTGAPVNCDDVCGNFTYFSGARSARLNLAMDPWKEMPAYVLVDVMAELAVVRCGGTLISKQHVLTSAYCFYQGGSSWPEETLVRLTAGANDLTTSLDTNAQIRYTTNITVHPDYNTTKGLGIRNMAIVTLSIQDSFDLNEHVFPICMQTAEMINPSVVEVYGYGWTSADYPNVVLKVLLMGICPFNIAVDLQCLTLPYPATPCHGDAGSPVTYALNGIYYTLGHINVITNPSCPLPPGILPAVKMSFFKDWIDIAVGYKDCSSLLIP